MRMMRIALFSFFFLFGIDALMATPTGVFWTSCTTDVLKYQTANIDLDNYFTITNRHHHGESFPTDVGLTYGLFSFYDFLHAEVGVDYLGGQRYPWYFNGKLGIDEGKLFNESPSLCVGIFDVGAVPKTRYNVWDAVIGHSLPGIGGRLFFGGYCGRHPLGPVRSGWMAAYERGFYSVHDADGTAYDKWVVAGDYASGKNVVGGGGFCVYYYFTPQISLLMGPVFFKDKHINGRWKWAIQLDCKV